MKARTSVFRQIAHLVNLEYDVPSTDNRADEQRGFLAGAQHALRWVIDEQGIRSPRNRFNVRYDKEETNES